MASVLGVAVRVGVGRPRLVGADVLVGVDILLGVDVVAGVDIAVGLGDDARLVRAGVVVEVQPAARASAAAAPATTNAAGFTQPL
jgi:hypothetical protein